MTSRTLPRWAARIARPVVRFTPRPAPGSLRRWARAEGGVAAIEFALILPVLVFMYLGWTEISFMVNTNRKLDLASRTLGDLTGRATAISSTELLNIMNATEAVMTPYKTKDLVIVISGVEVKQTKDSQGNVTGAKAAVAWSCQRASPTSLSAGLAAGTTMPVPAGFETATSYVHAKVTLPYAPVFGSAMLQTITGLSTATLEHAVSWPVRDSAQVSWSGSACK